ncbi:unnamed protein product [Acanthosepion pharaonis]|uniref:Uncharacterized protein n=1 Tax=Acanthosepion pharaonis TaxID=158019 RepID=A0A812C130_ACAPH|nr:unnamed protein product [Sepia pharaonis]
MEIISKIITHFSFPFSFPPLFSISYISYFSLFTNSFFSYNSFSYLFFLHSFCHIYYLNLLFLNLPQDDSRHHGVGFAVKNSLIPAIVPPTGGSKRILALRLLTSTGFANVLCIYAPMFCTTPEIRDQHPRSRHWHQLDLAITRRADLRIVLHTRSFHSANCDMDHSLVGCKVRLTAKKIHRSKTKGLPRINTCRPNDPESSRRFQTTFSAYPPSVPLTSTVDCTTSVIPYTPQPLQPEPMQQDPDGSAELRGGRGQGQAAGGLGGALPGAVCNPERGDGGRPGCLAQSPSHGGVGCPALCGRTRKSYRLSLLREGPWDGRDPIRCSEEWQAGSAAGFPRAPCLCWEKGHVPRDMRDANIVTLYKNKGDRSDCNNYRSISLLSVVGQSLPASYCHACRASPPVCNPSRSVASGQADLQWT